MFSFRRKGNKKQDDTPQIYTSPSLPLLNPQGIPWPENLVDVASIRQTPPPDHSQQGAAKTSFQGPDRAPIPFHKPFRGPPGKPADGKSISALYMSNTPSAFDNRRFTTASASSRQASHRRTRIPPTFNLMVVGGLGTGKTSLLRLLLDTADMSPSATADQQAAVDRFMRGSAKHTSSIQTACVEICESRFDRLLFSIIDTPGLDFVDGHELKLERQVNVIIKYVDAQYADTMSEESKVVRQSKGDQHIHLCIYMVDPASIMTPSARRARSAVPSKTRSETTISYRPSEQVLDASEAEDSDDESSAPLTMAPAEIRVIRRLTARCNVLPVVARADSLTDEKLLAVKDAVKRSLHEAGLDFGIFEPSTADRVETPRKNSISTSTDSHGPHVNGTAQENGEANGVEEHSDDGELDEDRESRPVIKLRSSRIGRDRSRSRSRRDLSEAQFPDANDMDSVANVRFSAHIVASEDLTSLLPFALIAPEGTKRRRRAVSSDAHEPQTPTTATTAEYDHGSIRASMQSPGSTHSRSLPYGQAPPDDLKGVFTRNFRWGSVDVLNPNHCDFAALRTAILSTHLKILKVHTKEVLYEKYRTQKLLARRATRNISDEEKKRLLEDLGL